MYTTEITKIAIISFEHFLTISRESGDNFTRVLLADQEAILEAGFCTLRNTKILIHGWTGSGTDRYIVTVRNGALSFVSNALYRC